MSIGLGHCIGILGTSLGGEAPDGNPSSLILTVDSDTQISGSFTIGSTNQDGHRVYISTDNITFTLDQTLTGTDNTFTTTGLIENTTYYFRPVS